MPYSIFVVIVPVGSTNIAGADLDACASLSKVEDLQGGAKWHFSQFEGVLIIQQFKFRRCLKWQISPDFEQGGLGGMSKNR